MLWRFNQASLFATPVGAHADIISLADFNLSRKMTLLASCFYYYYYVTTVKEPLHQCQRCAWHVLATSSRCFARVPSVHYRKSKSDCSATGKRNKNKTASVLLSVCPSVRLSSRDSHFSPRPCPSCPHQDPWPFISADSSNSCGHTKQAAAVTSCSCCGPFVLGGILRPCRLKLIPSFLLNQTAVVCAVWLQQELPECFLLGCRRGLRHLKASRTYLCRRVVI